MKKNHCLLIVALLGTLLFSEGIYAQAKPNNPIQGTYRTIFEMLKDVPGLEVKISTDKTGGSVVVRGIGSLNNQRPPLIVLDGVIFGGEIGTINAQDVDNISVLKDAASAGAYGSQGASGVIMITTKRNAGTTSRQADVTSHNESAYTYFIKQKTNLRVFGLDDKVIVEGPIQMQRDSVLVFVKKRKELLVPIKSISRVEMIPE